MLQGFKPLGKWARRLVLPGLLVLAVATGLGWLLLSWSIAGAAGRLLSEATGAEARVGSAVLRWDGTVVLRDVSVGLRAPSGEAGRIFEADRVEIKHRVSSFLRGRFKPRSVTLIGPVLYVTEDTEADRFNLQSLWRPAEPVGPAPAVVATIPDVYVGGGEVRFGEAEGGVYKPWGSVRFNGYINPMPGGTGEYFYRLQQEVPGDLSGGAVALTGRINLVRGSIEGKLENVQLDQGSGRMLPGEVRRLWQRLDPAGLLRWARFRYDAGEPGGFRAEVAVEDAAVTLPHGENGFRMTEVSGLFTFRPDSIGIERLTGRFEDLVCKVDGRVEGFHRDAPFSLSIRTNPFAIPTQPRHLPTLPSAVQEQMQRFSPTGVFEALVQVHRDEPGGAVCYEGVVRVSDATLCYEKFRYPLHEVAGELRFDAERIEIVELTGSGPTGARVTIRGEVTPPGKYPRVNLTIDAEDAPIDEVLYAALPEKHRRVADLFFDQQAYRSLLDRGLIRAAGEGVGRGGRWAEEGSLREAAAGGGGAASRAIPDPDAAGGSSEDLAVPSAPSEPPAPVFELGGRATCHVIVERERGPDTKHQLTIELRPAGVNLVMGRWAYPMRAEGGLIRITRDRTTLQGVQLRGPTGASGQVSGTIETTPSEDGGRAMARVRVSVGDLRLPLDELALATVPPGLQQTLRDLRLRGDLAGGGEVFTDEQGELDYRIALDFQNGSAAPYGGGFKVEQLAGAVELRRGGARVDSLRGRHGESSLTFSADSRWADGEQRLAVVLQARDLDLREPVLDLLPPDNPFGTRARQLRERLRVEGLVDATLEYQTGGNRDALYRLELSPKQLRMDVQQRTVTLSNMSGKLTLTPDHLALEGVGGTLEGGRFYASGTATLGEEQHVELQLEAEATEFSPAVRALLPAEVVSVIDKLDLHGTYQLQDGRLSVEINGSQRPGFQFRGKARLVDAGATVGVPLTGINGDLYIEAYRTAESPQPWLDLHLDARRLLAAGRLISPLSIHLASGETPQRLVLRDLRGRCYGGSLLGAGQIVLAEPGMYRTRLVLQDVALDPFIHPGRYPDWGEPGSQTASTDSNNHEGGAGASPATVGRPQTGVLAASLTVEGSLADPNRRRGRGEVEIRDAGLYEVPLAMAVMQIMNLSLPASRSFDRASARYLIDDDLVRFDSIRFEAPTIEIAGTGTMRYSTLQLNVDMFTKNPAGLRFGLLSDLFQVFKDELLSIHVDGTLDQPEPRPSSFQGIRRSWQEIFGTRRKPSQAPLPAVAGKPQISPQ